MKICKFNPIIIDTAAIARRNKEITFPPTTFSSSGLTTKSPATSPQSTLGYTTTPTGELLPLPYDGSIPWDCWLLLFDCAASINNWSPNTASEMLVLSLRGPVLALCLSLPEGTRRDPGALRGALAQALCPQEPLEVLLQQLKERRRRPQEPLRHLQVEVSALVRQVYEGMEEGELERHARAAFLRCIEESEYGGRTVEAQPKTLEEAVRMAEFYERREMGGEIPK